MNIYKKLRPLLGVVFVLCLVYSCKKKEGPTAGIEVQPENSQLGLFSTDTFEVEVTIQHLDSVRTDGYTLQSVGSYQDPIFGTCRNSYFTQYRLSSENIDVNQLRTFIIDSVVLVTAYAGYYGDLDPQNFTVHKVTEDIFTDSTYYSNHNVQFDPVEIGKKENHTPNPEEKFTEPGDVEVSELRIRLDSTFGLELFNAPALAYTSNAEFLRLFKGFLVKSNNTSQTANTGGQLLFDLENEYSRLIVYYKNPSGEKGELEYLINDKCAKFNLSDNDYAGSEVETAISNPTFAKNKLYVQSMGGIVSVLKVPYIKELIKNGPVIINRAKFILSIEEGSNSRYAPLPGLYFFGITESGNLFDTPDRIEPHFDEKLTADLNYSMTMTRYYQQVLNNKYQDRGLMLMELAENYGRSVIGGVNSSNSPLKFVVSYTPIN